MLTDEELAAIKARCAKATPDDVLCMDRYDHGGGRMYVIEDGPHDRQLIADFYDEGNREFYASARTDIPRLVAEVERMRSIVDAAKAYRASHAAIYDVRKHEPNTDFYRMFSDKWVAECKLFAAIDAAEGGG